MNNIETTGKDKRYPPSNVFIWLMSFGAAVFQYIFVVILLILIGFGDHPLESEWATLFLLLGVVVFFIVFLLVSHRFIKNALPGIEISAEGIKKYPSRDPMGLIPWNEIASIEEGLFGICLKSRSGQKLLIATFLQGYVDSTNRTFNAWAKTSMLSMEMFLSRSPFPAS